MKILRVEPPKDTKYTVELSHEEMIIIEDCVRKQGRYYGAIDGSCLGSSVWQNIPNEIKRVLYPPEI